MRVSQLRLGIDVILRPYQIDAVVATWDYLERVKTGNPLIAAPTGTGKSAIVAAICKRFLMERPFERVLVMTHVQELLEQNSEKLRNLWQQAPIGMYSAGLGVKQVGFPITFASVQSIVKHPELIGKVGLVIIDEAHLVSPKDETSYQKVLDYVFRTNPNARCVGLTATPFRLGLGYLTEGGVFDDICYDLCNRESFNWLIEQGYLCKLVPKITQSTFDLTGVASRGGEFVESDLQRAVDKQELTEKIVKEMIRSSENRNRWLVFAAGLEHARHVLGILEAEGIESAMVDGVLDKGLRKERLDAFKAGQIRCMVNNSVLTTGFDCPEIDMIAMLRPTKSPSLWVQMLGRGTRPFPGKNNCLVLDFGRNTERLGPINDPVIPSKKKDGAGGGKAPTRLCPECGTYFHASLKICPECGFEVPENLNKWTAEASAKALIAEDAPELVELVPTQMVYAAHQSRRSGKPPSMEVSYYCGYNRIREYVHFELPGYLARKASQWWAQRATGPVPQTTAVAVAAAPHLPVPTKIVVDMSKAKKHPEVVRCEFASKTNFVQGTIE